MESIKSNLIATVQYLSKDIGQRSYRDIVNLNKTASYIENAFSSMGYKPIRQSYVYRGNQYYNISVEASGVETSKNDIIVIGAHYDTIVGTSGADDNASGIAGLLELARLIRIKPISRTIHFVAFTLEEPPAFFTKNMGSYIYAKGLYDRGVKVYGMISLEMLGYYSDNRNSQFYFPFSFLKWFYPDTGNFIAFLGNLSSRPFSSTFKKSFKAVSSFPVESLNTPSIVPGINFSDNYSFWRLGYPAIMITDTAFMRNRNYHKDTDTGDTLDYDKFAELVKGLFNALCILP
jgi:Zn-dependent M28 family amino/carboxypeptidase